MKIKLSQIVDSVEGLKVLQGIKFQAKVSYRIKRLVDKLGSILKSYEEERNKLVEEYGEKGEDGVFKVDPAVNEEKFKIFAEKYGELVETEEEIDFQPIKVEMIGDAEVAPKDLIDWVFEE